MMRTLALLVTSFISQESESIRFDFSDERWSNVLEMVAKANGLTLQLDFPPPGRFSYKDPKSYSPVEALDLVHSVLLDRGLTLIRKGGVLMVARLGDDMPWELISFVPADKLEHVAPHEMVVTSIPIHSVTGSRLASELELALSPRGKMLGGKSSRRVVVYDQAAICLKMKELLYLVDPPLDSEKAHLRIYELKHASAVEAAAVIRDLIGQVNEPEKKQQGGGDDFFDLDSATNVLFNREFLSSFTPGFSMQGVGQETKREKLKTRLTVERVSNSLLLFAEPDILGKVDVLMKAMDQPSTVESAAPIIIRSYTLKRGDGAAVARRLETILGTKSNCSVSGVDRWVVVRATAPQQEEAALLIQSLMEVDEELAAFPMKRRRAEDLVEQLGRIFDLDGQSSPRIVADTVQNALLVRGTREQIEQVRQILSELGEFEPGGQAAPSIKVGVGSRGSSRGGKSGTPKD